MDNLHADFPPPPDDDLPGIGHNSPPEPMTALQVTEALARGHTLLTARHDQLVQAAADFVAKYPTIETEDVAAAATENLAMFGKALRMAEDLRTNAKEPHLVAGRAVDAWFNRIKASLKDAEGLVARPATAYAQRIKAERLEAARLASAVAAREAERAAQAAHEAAEAERASADHLLDTAIAAANTAEIAEAKAATKPAAFSRTVGTYGSTSSLRETWDVEVVSLADVPREFFTLDMPALRRAVREGARAIPGCRVYPVETLKARA